GSWFSVEVDEQIWSLVDPHPVQLGMFELGDQALPDGDSDDLGGGDLVQEFGDLFVEEAMVHGIEDLAVHDVFESLEVDNEAGARIDFSLYRDFQCVVVAMAVGVVAFAEDTAILFRSELRVVVVVRGGEFSFAREIDHKKQLPVISGQLPVNALRPNTRGPSKGRYPSRAPWPSAARDRRTEEGRGKREGLRPTKNGRGGFAPEKTRTRLRATCLPQLPIANVHEEWW